MPLWPTLKWLTAALRRYRLAGSIEQAHLIPELNDGVVDAAHPENLEGSLNLMAGPPSSAEVRWRVGDAAVVLGGRRRAGHARAWFFQSELECRGQATGQTSVLAGSETVTQVTIEVDDTIISEAPSVSIHDSRGATTFEAPSTDTATTIIAEA